MVSLHGYVRQCPGWGCCIVVWQCWLGSDYVCPGLPQIRGYLLPQSPKWTAGITDMLQHPVRKCSIYDSLQFPQPGPQSSSIFYSFLDSNVSCTFSEIFGIETDSLPTCSSLLSLHCPVMTRCYSPGNLMIKRNWLVLGFRGRELWDQGTGTWRMPSLPRHPKQKVKGQESAGGSETLFHTGSNFTETDFPRIRATLIYSNSNGQTPTNYWWAVCVIGYNQDRWEPWEPSGTEKAPWRKYLLAQSKIK